MDKNKVEAKTLSGFMELDPKSQLTFNKIISKIRKAYESYGYLPLDTPVLEHSSVLLAKAGGETEKQVYRFSKGDTDLTMRFDLTVPLAKYCAKNFNSLHFPFKRYQIGKVYRGERAQRGRFREFYQADIDIIGNGDLDLMNDAEIPATIYSTFKSLGLDDFTIRINNRRVLSGFFEVLGISDMSDDVMKLIDKAEKIGEENLILTFKDYHLSDETIEQIMKFIKIDGNNAQKLDKLKEFSGKSELFDQGLEELETVTKYIAAFNVPEDNFEIDLMIARGLDYYTGTVYETRFNKHPEIGSVCSGGRYDNLAEFYTDNKLPGVGISIGVTRLFFILNDMNYLNRDGDCPSDALILPMTDDFAPAINVSNAMREADLKAQIYFEKKKMKNKINYASRLGIPFVIFIGEDEIANNTVSVKDLSKGEQETMSLNVAVDMIKEYNLGLQSTKVINVNRNEN